MDVTFNAWSVSAYGGPEVLRPVTRPLPAPRPTEVLIRQKASAVLCRESRPIQHFRREPDLNFLGRDEKQSASLGNGDRSRVHENQEHG
jgi:NADPH:quinone reductase-like Zn-dependent oxidoreductase